MKNLILIFTFLLIGTTVIGQTTWYEIPTGTNSKLNAIDFPSDNVGYIVGSDSTILKSTDGGQTWTGLGLNGISVTGLDDDFTDIKFINETVGFIVCGYSGVYKTIDGGQNWTQITGQTSNMCFPHTVHPITDSYYLLGGAGCFEGAIIDHFASGTWTNANLGMNFWDSNQTVEEMSFYDLNRGLAATRSEYILKTIDGGFNWDTISTGIGSNSFLTSVLMVNDTLCYAGYIQTDSALGSWGLLKSTDGGLTWGYDNSTANFIQPQYLSVCATQNGTIYSGANSGQGPGGLIFEVNSLVGAPYEHVDQPINGMTSYGSDITFGVGDSGYLVVNRPINELGIDESNQIEFKVYPNPVLNELTIENPTGELLELTILDASGRALISKIGQSEVSKIDCSALHSGMYLVKVKIDERIGVKQFVKTN